MKTNHLELNVKINGVKGRFILDTGASNTCIGTDLGIYFNILSEKSEIKAAGAGAIDMETSTSKNNIIKLGKWKTRNCELVLLDLSHVNNALNFHNEKQVHGIIGADILEIGKAIIDYDKKVLYLKKTKKNRKQRFCF